MPNNISTTTLSDQTSEMSEFKTILPSFEEVFASSTETLWPDEQIDNQETPNIFSKKPKKLMPLTEENLRIHNEGYSADIESSLDDDDYDNTSTTSSHFTQNSLVLFSRKRAYSSDAAPSSVKLACVSE